MNGLSFCAYVWIRRGVLSFLAVAFWSVAAHAVVINPSADLVQQPSNHAIIVDGYFSDSLGWSDIQPLSFVSEHSLSNLAVCVADGDSSTNRFLYATIASGALEVERELHLMYDYPAGSQTLAMGAFMGSVSFPVDVLNLSGIPSINNLPSEIHALSNTRDGGIAVKLLGRGSNSSSFFDLLAKIDGRPLSAFNPLPKQFLQRL